jgi:hypothetical protein
MLQSGKSETERIALAWVEFCKDKHSIGMFPRNSDTRREGILLIKLKNAEKNCSKATQDSAEPQSRGYIYRYSDCISNTLESLQLPRRLQNHILYRSKENDDTEVRAYVKEKFSKSCFYIKDRHTKN